MRKATSNTKNNKQSLENTVKTSQASKEVKTDSVVSVDSPSTCNTVCTDASNTDNESYKYLITPYAENKRYYFEVDPIYQKLIKQTDNEIAYRISTMLYADCISWRKQADRFFELKGTIIDTFDFGIELIKFWYGIAARRNLLYSIFVDNTAEIEKLHCLAGIKSYTVEEISCQIDSMYDMINETVEVIIEYGCKNPEVIFAIEVVNSYVM